METVQDLEKNVWFKRKKPNHTTRQSGRLLVDKWLIWGEKKCSCVKKKGMKEEVLRQIAEPDARMKKNTKT